MFIDSFTSLFILTEESWVAACHQVVSIQFTDTLIERTLLTKFLGGQDEFAREMVRAHNTYRKKHGAPPLSWSAPAAKKAQDWANHLASVGRLEHGNHDGLGQNLAFYSGGTLTPQHATDMWYNEIKQYNFNQGGFASNTGHFTQLVWVGTTQVGIAHAIKGQTTYVVANYAPPGNVQGRFEENVKPPK